MTGLDHTHWIEANQQALTDELSWLQALLEAATAGADTASIEPPDTTSTTLDFLAEQFGLSNFERTIILLCAGMELSSDLALLCTKALSHTANGCPNFGLALALLPEAHWSALSPGSPLRYWQLVQVDSDIRITSARLSLDERILHYLLGAGRQSDRPGDERARQSARACLREHGMGLDELRALLAKEETGDTLPHGQRLRRVAS